MKQGIKTNFVSDIDLFCAEFDRTHPLSSSQLSETTKYQRIYELRDQPLTEAEIKDVVGGDAT